ncbi:MAG: protein kinase domain-containing protein [Catenulispora sp.]
MQTLGAGDPQQIGPYVVTGRLGTGGMGSVYLGWDAAGRPAAVKVVRSDFLQDPDFRARFRREISSARRVTGPWISRVLDADPDAASPWLATEYVAGPTLDAAVNRFGPLPAGTVAVLAECLGQALQAVHSAGVVHRDIKPNNILLAADGPRLIDFGIARATDDTKLTATHAGVFGVAGFIAPERLERQVLLPAGDVFAGGAVLAFAATGKMAFGGGEPVTVAYRVVHGEPDLEGLPDELLPLVRACLAKDPAGRPDAGRLAAEAARVRGASNWPGVPTAVDWAASTPTSNTYELASTWLPEPLARHTVQDYDLSAGFAAAETARLALEHDPRMAPALGAGGLGGPGAAGMAGPGGPVGFGPGPSNGPSGFGPGPSNSPSGFGPGRPVAPGPGGTGGRDTGTTKQMGAKRRRPLVIAGAVAVLAAGVIGGAMAVTSGGDDNSGPNALQGAGSNSQTPSGPASGKDAADLSQGGSQRSGDNLPTSAAAPEAGSAGATGSSAPSSAAGGAPSSQQHQPSSAGSSTSHAAGAPSSHPSTGNPGTTGPRVSNPAPTTSQAAPPPSPAPVPCSGTVSTSQGTGHNCTFDTPGDGKSGGSPVLKGDGSSAGYLHQGTNWVICQATGRTQHQGQYYNKWWAYTESDTGIWGWVNAVSAAGGDNDGGFGGVPMCDGAHGSPPQ